MELTATFSLISLLSPLPVLSYLLGVMGFILVNHLSITAEANQAGRDFETAVDIWAEDFITRMLNQGYTLEQIASI